MRKHLGVCFVLIAAAACSGFEADGKAEVSQDVSSADAIACVNAPDEIPYGGWQCGEDRVLQCGAAVPRFWVTPTFRVTGTRPLPSCHDVSFSTQPPLASFPPGIHELTVVQQSPRGSLELCRTTVTVEDTIAPVAIARDQTIWPPNHQLHPIPISDCVHVTDGCDPLAGAYFTAVTSDEPEDARGDGVTAPDVLLTCDTVKLRGERQGGADGRVYRLFWRVVDQSGNAVVGSCSVGVPHDPSGAPAIEGNAAYRVELEGPR